MDLAPTVMVTMTSLELVDYINAERQGHAEAQGAQFPSKGHAKLDHADFLKKVPEVLGDDAGNFSGVYMGGNGQERPCYRFPKREACLMAMSYSYELQAKVFDRMTALELGRALPGVPRTFAQALRLAAEQAEHIEAQAAQLELQRPAVEFLGRYVEARSAKGLREVSKILGQKEHDFIAWLADTGVTFKQGRYWLPKAEHQHAGYFEVKTGESNGHAYHQMRFTPKGVAWIAERVAKRDAERLAKPALTIVPKAA